MKIAHALITFLRVCKLSSEFFIKKMNSYYIFLISFILLISLSLVVGIIPVNNGLGWDGERYFSLATNIFSQGWSSEDPYRAIRLSAFPVLIMLKAFNVATNTILYTQAVINAVFLSLSCVALYKSMLNINISKPRSIMGVFLILLTWPSLVMTTFYPILTDHAALALSCFALLAWTAKKNSVLYIILFYSFWVMPSLILVPFALLAWPFDAHTSQGRIVTNRTASTIAIALALLISASFIYKIYSLDILSIVDDRVNNFARNKTSLTTSIKWLYPLSIAMCSAMLAFTVFKTIIIMNNIYIWKSIKLSSLFFAMIVSLLSILAIFMTLDFKTGFTGPSLLKNMLAQSIAAPLKSIVSHFFYFGPFFILAYFNIINNNKLNLPFAPLIISLAYLPLLVVGSESRQWLMVLPSIVLCGMHFNFNRITGCMLFIISIILLLPSITLNKFINQAINSNDGFQDYTWQNYFAYQGPWLNTGFYSLGVILLALFILVILLSKKTRSRNGFQTSDKKDVNCRNTS